MNYFSECIYNVEPLEEIILNNAKTNDTVILKKIEVYWSAGDWGYSVDWYNFLDENGDQLICLDAEVASELRKEINDNMQIVYDKNIDYYVTNFGTSL